VNPFDDTSARFRILANEKGQYSLWPDDLDVPAGWRTVCAGLGHQEALEHVDSVWTDLRPLDVGNGDVVDG
jgi:MbtH protein